MTKSKLTVSELAAALGIKVHPAVAPSVERFETNATRPPAPRSDIRGVKASQYIVDEVRSYTAFCPTLRDAVMALAIGAESTPYPLSCSACVIGLGAWAGAHVKTGRCKFR